MSAAMVDATRAREHLQHLLDNGMTQADIVRASGLSQAAISALIHGAYVPGRPRQENVQELTEARVLAVEYKTPPERREVTAKAKPTLEHGTYAGYETHRRAKDEICELCMAAKRGYQVALRRQQAPAAAGGRLPDDLTVQLLKVCRAIVLRRPIGSIETLAREALRAATGQQAEVNR